MTNRNLGRLLTLLLLMQISLIASVTAKVDRAVIYAGDPLTLTIEATGSNIEFPNIDEIDGFMVQGRATGRNIVISNGKRVSSQQLRVTISPDKSITIPPFNIKIDGNIQKTKPIHIKVVEPKAEPDGAAIQLVTKSSKSEVYIGESLKFDIIFRYKRGVRIDDISIATPQFDGFWAEPINSKPVEGIDQDGYITRTISYILFAQQDGKIKIPSVVAEVGTRSRRVSLFGPSLQYKRVYSDTLELTVKPLPTGIDLYGEFKLRSSIDKKRVEASRAVNLKIEIEGYGNVGDIDKFEPIVDGAIVYANDPVVQGYIKNGRYYGKFEQSIAVVMEQNSTIPAMEFKYLDSKTNKVVTKHTQPYEIEVIGAKPQQHTTTQATIQTDQNLQNSTEDEPEIVVLILISFFTGALSASIFWWLYLMRSKDPKKDNIEHSPITKQIQKAEDDKELFLLLLPYKNLDSFMDEVLLKLEKNLYADGRYSIDKSVILKHLADSQQKIELL